MTLTFEEIIERIITRYDPDVVVDILELSTESLLRAFPDEVEEKISSFDDVYLGEEGD